jgi:hypothetical protein
MNAEHFAAFWADPPFFFGSYEMPYAEFSNVLKIADHAHAILGFIPSIQMLQPVAGEAVTSKAVLDFGVHQLFAVLDFAFYAGFRFEAVVAPASRARFPLSCECAAETAIHSAGSDQLRGNRGRICRFF